MLLDIKDYFLLLNMMIQLMRIRLHQMDLFLRSLYLKLIAMNLVITVSSLNICAGNYLYSILLHNTANWIENK